MFWGLILEPNKRYTQTVEKSFHVSMASLNLQKADDSVVQVMLYYEGTSYLLCNLRKSSTWQVPLDLNFHEGTTIAFICHGHGHVHLTGYLIPDEDLDLDELEEGEEEEEEEDDDEQVPQLVDKQSKRKAIDTLKNEKNTKRLKQEIEAESSDEDIELDGMNEENDSDDSEEGDEESLLNEDEDEDEDEEGGEEDKEDEEEEEKVKPQKKDKRNKQQQQQQQQQKKKILNGKEAKQKKDKREQQQNEINTQSEQKTRVVEGGVQIKELKVGNGAFAKSGKLVSVYYVGRLKNGKKFDATTQGDGFKFRLGKGEVIKGWDIGIQGMKVGGKRQITIPPAMAYGAKGSPPVIPGNSTLMFEVELRNVH